MSLIDFKSLEPFNELLKEIYGDLAKPGVQNVGIALSAILGLGITIMWPIMWANERTKIALEHNLLKYKTRIAKENLNNISIAAPEVAMPIVEKFAYVTNEELCELYIELLAKASIKNLNNYAHPSFVNILNNLSPDEAKLIKRLKGKEFIPFANIEVCSPTGSFITIEEFIVDLQLKNLDLSYLENLSAYF